MRVHSPVILASASPRRKELISLAFSNVTICPSTAEETIPLSVSAEEVALQLSQIKAQDVADQRKDLPVIGCDTIVISRGAVLTKPRDCEDAFRMLKELSGNEHTVCTGCTVIYQGKSLSFYETTRVRFWNLSDEQIHSYVATGEPMDKAGAYGIQSLGSLFVREIQGDYFNVVGLPVSRLYREFRSFLPSSC